MEVFVDVYFFRDMFILFMIEFLTLYLLFVMFLLDINSGINFLVFGKSYDIIFLLLLEV